MLAQAIEQYNGKITSSVSFIRLPNAKNVIGSHLLLLFFLNENPAKTEVEMLFQTFSCCQQIIHISQAKKKTMIKKKKKEEAQDQIVN